MAPRCGERGAYWYPRMPPSAVVPPGPLAEGARPTKASRRGVGGNPCCNTPTPPPPPARPAGPPAEGARTTEHHREPSPPPAEGTPLQAWPPVPAPPAWPVPAMAMPVPTFLSDAAVPPTIVDISTDEEEVPTIMLTAEEAAEYARFYAAYGRFPVKYFRADV